jgi:hypothetical protein
MKKFLVVFIIGIALLFFSYKFYLKKHPMKAFQDAMIKARKYYSKEICDNAERIFRLETAHFKSGQFQGTYSPGMEKFSDTYPYGWKTLDKYVWSKHPEYKPIGLRTFTENGTGKQKTFVQFPSVEASLFTMCAFLQAFNNNPGRWFSLNTDLQIGYNQKISKINPVFSNGIA